MAIRREEQDIRPDGGRDDASEWQLEAACRGHDAAAFFAPPHFERKEVRLARERHAKSVCRGCPVKDACLDYALRTREPHGVWGGLNEIERQRLLVVQSDRGR